MSDINQQKFICIDCETTGLEADKDRIIEVAAVLFDMRTVYDQTESLVNPECTIPSESIEIHHITQEMVQDQPVIVKILPDLLKFIGDNIIVGHGVGFDIEIIAQAADRHRIPHTLRKNPYLDTLRMARLYGESPINSLEHLRKHFNVPQEGAHRAMSDVVVNMEVFKHLAKRYKTTKQVFEALSKPIYMPNMPLGKHKGRPLRDIPLQYLQYMVKKDYDQDLLFSLRTELKRRRQGNTFGQANNPFQQLG